jgi:hypothetical protein
MKIAFAAAAVTLASLSIPVITPPANAQILPPGHARTTNCGPYRDICAAARTAHAKRGFYVTRLYYLNCNNSTSPGGSGCRNGWRYSYWWT